MASFYEPCRRRAVERWAVGRWAVDRLPASQRVCERPHSMATPKKKKGKKENREKQKEEKERTADTTHPSLLRLLSYAKVVLAGPVHGWYSGGGESRKAVFDEGQQGGKRDLTSGLGRVLKYLLTTVINNPIQINRKFNAIPRTRPHHFQYPGSPGTCAYSRSFPQPERRHHPPRRFIPALEFSSCVPAVWPQLMKRFIPFLSFCPLRSLLQQGPFHSSPSILASAPLR